MPRLVTPAPDPTCAPLEITSLLPESAAIDTMSVLTLTCALEPIRDGLTYTWTASSGEISGAGDMASYQSDLAGSHTITVSVQDELCGQDARSVSIEVLPAQPTPPQYAPDPNSILGAVWHASARVRRKLGWAVEGEIKPLTAQQSFEGGTMFWIDRLDAEGEPNYALFDDGTWHSYQGTWDKSMPKYSCPDLYPVDPIRTPINGFGEIWCQIDGPDSALGWALAVEYGSYPFWIRFQHGEMVACEDGPIYILYDDWTWELWGEPAVQMQILDDFEGYATGADLNAAYGVTAPGNNACRLALASGPHVGSGTQGAAFAYRIDGPSADYCGFDRMFSSPLNWSAYDWLRVWVQHEGGADELVVQFREAGGETWKQRFDLASLGGQELEIVLDENALELGDDAHSGARLDLDRIDQLGFYVNGRPGAEGTLYVDSIRLIGQANKDR
jgi:hypothetical protein